ncbi:MAG: helix-turn-helix domain-containing protein [Butyricicoccus sp.]|nr:helix-turn-helix domain-containing protein [Butyricicoccus sp.]
MSLSEKITALRTGLKLSQGDVAEKLGVSRQSVSKWETGQSVPELDKIVKLADLFGVSVDELVRDGDAPRAAPPPREEAPEARIVYVERRLAPTQVIGAVLLVLGLLGVIFGVAVSGNSGTYTALIGGGMVLLGLPFLLSRRHPFLIAGWVVLAVSCLLFSPLTSIARWGILDGIQMLHVYLTMPEMHYGVYLFGAAVGIARGLLFLLLLFFTVRAVMRRRKARKEDE